MLTQKKPLKLTLYSLFYPLVKSQEIFRSDLMLLLHQIKLKKTRRNSHPYRFQVTLDNSFNPRIRIKTEIRIRKRNPPGWVGTFSRTDDRKRRNSFILVRSDATMICPTLTVQQLFLSWNHTHE